MKRSMSMGIVIQRLLLLSLLMLSLFGLSTLRSVWEEKAAAEARLRQLEVEVRMQTDRNGRLEQHLETLEQGSALERLSREELFLVYPDEKIMIETGN